MAVLPNILCLQAGCEEPWLFFGAFWLRKVTTDLRILAHVSIVCPDDRYQKLQIYNAKLILHTTAYQ